jgi:hypothetical protein
MALGQRDLIVIICTEIKEKKDVRCYYSAEISAHTQRHFDDINYDRLQL